MRVLGMLAALLALPFGQWRIEDRVLVTDFSVISALAASPFTVFAATPRGLLLYDRPSRSWRLPVTGLEGYPPARVSVALADATDDAVWLGTSDGWARYDTRSRQWTSGPVPGGVSDIALDAQDPASGVYLRGATGWTFLPRGALIPFLNRVPPGRLIRPLDPRVAMAQTPQADALRSLILTDPRLRSYQFTAAARSPDQPELFLGTNGIGVIRFDGFGAQWDVLPFGLPAPGSHALAPAPDGVWVGLVPRAREREGLAFLASDLGATRWLSGEGGRGFGFREARRLLARAGRLWVATEQGVARVDPARERADMFDILEPLALAPAPDGVWVGSARGLALIKEDGTMQRFDMGGIPVLSLLALRDTLWVGTTNGLGVLEPGGSSPRRTDVVPDPVVALARRGDTLVFATPDQLAWRGPDGRWTLLRPRADLGRLSALATDAQGVWVGGAFGLALWRIGAGTFATVRVPNDLPAGVRDLLPAPPYLWVATDSGVVRFRREAILER